MDSLDKVLRNQNLPNRTTPTSSKANTPAEPVCPICGGLGLVKKNVPVDHPDFGKAFPCICQQDKIATRKVHQLEAKSNLHSYTHLRFDSFQTSLEWLTEEQNGLLHMAYELSRQYAEQPDEQWLVLQGGYGSGKTHLAAAIGNYRLHRHQPVIFMTVPDLLDHLRRTYTPDAQIGYDDLFEQIKATPLLILDDLGSQSPTAWATEKMFQLLNHRYVNQLATVITTNESIEKLDARIKSRLVDHHLSRIIDLDLPDYRRGGELQHLSTLSNLRLYAHMTFETFELRRDILEPEKSHNLARALELAQNYAQNPQGWLMYVGEHGCGKTHLAASIANYRQAIEPQEPVMLVTVAELVDYLREAFNPDARTTLGNRFNEIRNVPLLILDHFQLTTATPWAQEKLFQIMDYRYLAQMPTVITKPGNSIDDLSAAFQSRLADARLCRVFYVQVPDYRGGTGVVRTSNR